MLGVVALQELLARFQRSLPSGLVCQRWALHAASGLRGALWRDDLRRLQRGDASRVVGRVRRTLAMQSVMCDMERCRCARHGRPAPAQCHCDSLALGIASLVHAHVCFIAFSVLWRVGCHLCLPRRLSSLRSAALRVSQQWPHVCEHGSWWRALAVRLRKARLL